MSHIEPELIAYADQRIASCAAFLDSMIASETTDVLVRGAGDSLAVLRVVERPGNPPHSQRGVVGRPGFGDTQIGGTSMSVNINRDKAAQRGLDPDALQSEIAELLRSGMPDAVALGFMTAKAQGIVDRHDETEARRILDELGKQTHQGDPVKKARIEQFNDMLIAELKKRQGTS